MTKATPMFTIEQIHDIHDRLGTMERFPDYVRALTAVGVERYDSYLADGPREVGAAAEGSVPGHPFVLWGAWSVAASCSGSGPTRPRAGPG
jgi:hypothetical protein